MDADLMHFRQARLQHAFHIVFDAIAVAKAEHIMHNGMPAEQAEEMVAEQLNELRVKGIDEAVLTDMGDKLRAMYLAPPNLLADERADAIRVLVVMAMAQLVRIWLEVLQKTRAKVQTDLVFLLLLDDAMLPSMDPDSAAEFERQCFIHAGFRLSEVREGLRLIRRNIPSGALLHHDAMALLGITPPDVHDA